jgi:hypothetical protein
MQIYTTFIHPYGSRLISMYAQQCCQQPDGLTHLLLQVGIRHQMGALRLAGGLRLSKRGVVVVGCRERKGKVSEQARPQ